MRKIFLLLAFVLFSSPAYAQMGIYVAPKISMGSQHASFLFRDQVVNADGSLGAAVGTNTRFRIHGFNMGYGLALGYDLNTSAKLPLRLELDCAMYTKVETLNTYNITGGVLVGNDFLFEFDLKTLLVNIYYDFRKSDKDKDNGLVPYVGVGLGTYFGTISGVTRVHDFTDIAFNVALGLAYELNESLALDFGYRYVYLNDVSLLNIGLGKGGLNRFQLSARILF